MQSTTSYTVLTNNNGTKLISQWLKYTIQSQTLTATFTNPLAAITYSLSGVLYFN